MTKIDKSFLNKLDLVCFHKGCFDGISCALIIYKFYIDNKLNLPKFNSLPAGEKDINILKPYYYKNKNVLIADVAFNREITLKLKNECSNFILIDHHISNYNLLKDLDFCFFDLNKSASRLVFEIFYPNQKIPSFVLRIEDNDIMKTNPSFNDFKHFNVALQIEFQKHMNVENNGFDTWMQLFDEKRVDELNKIGQYYYVYKNFIIENNNKFYKKVQILNFSQFNVLCFPDTHIVGLSSDLLHSIEDKCDIAMLYKFLDNKKKYLITMRTNKDIDLVELFGNICAGHSKAVSGFISDINKFIKIIS